MQILTLAAKMTILKTISKTHTTFLNIHFVVRERL